MQGNELRWPAEWEQQEAVWLSWPHRDDLWQGGLQELHERYAELAAAIAQEAEVRINAAAPLIIDAVLVKIAGKVIAVRQA